MSISALTTRRIAGAALLIALTAAPGWSQWGGRANEAVIYLFSKSKMDFKVAPSAATNAGITGFQVVNPATVTSVPISPDFAAKRVQVLHKETGDLFELVTQVENIPTPRARVTAPAKVLTLNGILRDANEGSVSLAPIDVTGGIYVPYIPGVAQGPDVATQTAQSLLWTPSDSAPVFVQVPDGTHSNVGPAGETGIEFQAFEGNEPFFIAWENMWKLYPADRWPEGIDLMRIDPEAVDAFFDPPIGNNARLFRLRPSKTTPSFTLTSNTHFYVLQGSVTVTPAGGSAVTIPTGSYAFIPAGYAISVANPRVFSVSPPTVDGN